MTSARVGAFTFPADMFPIVLEWYAEASGQLLHTLTIDTAGVGIVPPLSEPVCVWARYGDGSTYVVTTSGSYNGDPRSPRVVSRP